MIEVTSKLAKAPLKYIADLRTLSLKKYLLIHTNFSPSYPIMILTSLTTTLMVCVFYFYYVLANSSSNQCLQNITGATYILVILYPIETILFFICISGSIALSKGSCKKVILIIFFGPLLCGFGFGELGIISLCLFSVADENDFKGMSLIKNKDFINAMVYLYISFFILYFLLIPVINYLYERQLKDQEQRQQRQANKKSMYSKMKQQKVEQAIETQNKRSCCGKLMCFFYYFLNIFFDLSAFFIIFIKVVGPIIYTYLWIKISTINSSETSKYQKRYLGLILTAYFSPLCVMILCLGIQRIFKRSKNQKDVALQDRSSMSNRNTLEIKTERSSRISDDLQQISSDKKEGLQQVSRNSAKIEADLIKDDASKGRQAFL